MTMRRPQVFRDASGSEPWFRRCPAHALTVGAGLYVAVFLASLVVGEVGTVALLYTFPVALLALSFGRTGGLLAGALSLPLLAIALVVNEDTSFRTVDWLSVAGPLALIGALLGHAATVDERAEATRLELVAARLRQREAAEITDGILQGLTVAKWSLEVENAERALEVVSDTMATAQAHVRDLLGEDDRRLTVQRRG